MFKKYYSIFYIIISICLSYSFGFSEEVLIAPELQQFHRTTYNSLPLSAQANFNLERNGNLESLLKEVIPIAEKHNVGRSLGFRLAHRHHELNPQEIMVERFDSGRDKPALITKVEREDNAGAYPASWIFTPSGLTTFEYSDDPLVREELTKLSGDLGLFEEIREVARRYDLEDILAPTILGRTSFAHFNQENPLYELIQEETYASILVNKSYQEIEASTKVENLIRTTWGLENTAFPVLCVTYCHASKSDYKFHEFYHPGK